MDASSYYLYALFFPLFTETSLACQSKLTYYFAEDGVLILLCYNMYVIYTDSVISFQLKEKCVCLPTGNPQPSYPHL